MNKKITYKNYKFEIPIPEDRNVLIGSGKYHPDNLQMKVNKGEIEIKGDSEALEALGRLMIILAVRHKQNKLLHEHFTPGVDISSDSDEVYIGHLDS